MVSYTVDPHAPTPPSRQLVEAILDAVAGGALAPGDRVPSVRALAREALVNPNTVGKSYRDLEHLGVVQGRNGSGVFVTDDGPRIARERRRGETLAQFALAAEQALTAGVKPAALEREWQRVLRARAHANGEKR